MRGELAARDSSYTRARVAQCRAMTECLVTPRRTSLKETRDGHHGQNDPCMPISHLDLRSAGQPGHCACHCMPLVTVGEFYSCIGARCVVLVVGGLSIDRQLIHTFTVTAGETIIGNSRVIRAVELTSVLLRSRSYSCRGEFHESFPFDYWGIGYPQENRRVDVWERLHACRVHRRG